MTQMVIIACVGLFAGMMSSLLGIGGGIILVPAMVFFLEIPIRQAIGTSLAVILPTALMGVWKHGMNGYVNWQMAAMIAVLAVLGAYLGAAIGPYVSVSLLKKIFVILLLVTAFRLWFS